MTRASKKRWNGRQSAPLTEVRQGLSPLLREIDQRAKPLGISVRGEIRAYLLSPRQLRELEPATKRTVRRLRGSVAWIGDLEAGSRRAAEELLSAAKRSSGKP